MTDPSMHIQFGGTGRVAAEAQVEKSGLQKRIPCFCYGSNNVAQLRERCLNPQLAVEGAKLPGYRRIFAGKSANWAGGGVASVLPASNAICLGSVVMVSEDELLLLDRHEGIPEGNDPWSGAPPNRYRREHVQIELMSMLMSSETVLAIVYIRNNHEWEAYPSKAYLRAIHYNLGSLWPELDSDGALIVFDGKGVERGQWRPAHSPAELLQPDARLAKGPPPPLGPRASALRFAPCGPSRGPTKARR